jgi:hypothetical protein
MSWRVKLRSLMVVGQPVRAIDLFGAICEDIPLHHAARRQMGQRRGRKVPVIRMRWFAFVQEVARYRVRTDPPVTRGKRHEMTGETIITPYADPCARCGSPVFGHRERVNCTPCWNWHKGKSRRRQREERILTDGEETKDGNGADHDGTSRLRAGGDSDLDGGGGDRGRGADRQHRGSAGSDAQAVERS